jgi:hypothetical protein
MPPLVTWSEKRLGDKKLSLKILGMSVNCANTGQNAKQHLAVSQNTLGFIPINIVARGNKDLSSMQFLSSLSCDVYR